MTAGHADFTIEKNADFIKTILYMDLDGTPIDITGYYAKLSVSSNEGSFTIDSNSSSLVINGIAGSIIITILRTVSANFLWESGLYDLLIQSPTNIVTRVLEGKIKVVPGVTHI